MSPTTPRVPRKTVVWVVENQRILCESLVAILDAAGDLSCPYGFESAEDFYAALKLSDPPDCVLMDIGLPGESGIDAIQVLTSYSPTTRAIILTIHEEDDKVFQAICAGATGYLLKPSPPEAIVEAIRDVQRGGAPINPYIARKMLTQFARLTPREPSRDSYGLSPRENEILQLLVDGLMMRQIAAQLDLSYHTISNHLRNVYAKLHVRSRSAAVAKALREDLL